MVRSQTVWVPNLLSTASRQKTTIIDAFAILDVAALILAWLQIGRPRPKQRSATA